MISQLTYPWMHNYNSNKHQNNIHNKKNKHQNTTKCLLREKPQNQAKDNLLPIPPTNITIKDNQNKCHLQTLQAM